MNELTYIRQATDGTLYFTCNQLAVIASEKSVEHTARLLAHSIKKWMRGLRYGCNVFIFIGYRRAYPDEGHGPYTGLVDSAFCADRNFLYSRIEAFALEWVKYLKKYPNLQKDDGETTILHFCICNCEH